jgi:hypothetical protein
MMYLYELPLYATIGKKTVPLNLNWYRNAHYRALAQVKREYWPLESHPFKAREIRVHYRLVLCDRRRTDATNWISVADKFFMDWLVAQGYLPDDNCNHYSGGSWAVEKDLAQSVHRLYAQVEVIR